MIKLTYLDRQHKYIHSKLLKNYKKTLINNSFILGEDVNNFEILFSKFCDVKYAAGVGNGLDALRLSLMALGVGEGDEVIVPSNSFIATATAVSLVNAKPIFVDCTDNYRINIEHAKQLITRRTKAIIPVHLFGMPENMIEIIKFSKVYNLLIIEDCSQAHGAKFMGRSVGTFGEFGTFSFYPTKNLGAQGDGGAVISNNKQNIEKIKILRNYGSNKKNNYKFVGLNSRLDSLQAGILSTKLKFLDKWNKDRWAIAQIYLNELSGIKNFLLPEIDSRNVECVWHLFVVRCKDGNRNKLIEFLKRKKIMVGIHYPVPIHKAKVYRYKSQAVLRNSEKISKEILSLPMDPFLKKEEAFKVVNAIKEFYSL